MLGHFDDDADVGDAVDVISGKVEEGKVADLGRGDFGILPSPGFHEGVGACLGRHAVGNAQFYLVGTPHDEGTAPRKEVCAGESAVFRLILCRSLDVANLTTSDGSEEFSLAWHLIVRR